MIRNGVEGTAASREMRKKTKVSNSRRGVFPSWGCKLTVDNGNP